MADLRSPYPYFGGKSRVAADIWRRFGNPANFVDPFVGSLAVLLARPHAADSRGTETVNDLDGLLSNFWRSVQRDPDAVAHAADWIVNECDLHARHLWLIGQRERITERLMADPDYCDPKAAGWWVWGISQWIGSGWCSGTGPWTAETFLASAGMVGPLPVDDEVGDGQLPHLGDAGRGVHRKLPHLGAGMGVHRKLPHLGAGMREWESDDLLHTPQTDHLRGVMRGLSERLRAVRVACGDWTRVLGPTVTTHHGVTAVLLDPPYSLAERDGGLYAMDGDVAGEVREWALANGNDPLLRIALCGYTGEHAMPETWERLAWKAHGGYGSQGDGRGRENATREVIWFNQSCLRVDRPVQAGLDIFALEGVG